MPTEKTKRPLRFGRYDYAAFSSFFSYSSGSVIVPVALVALANELGFPLQSGGLAAGGALHLARTIPMVATMLLCGFMAGRWGKCKTFGISVALMAAGVLCCALTPSYGILFLGLVIAGCGEGVIEGLATPFVQDLHEGEEPGRYINFAHSFWSIGVLATVLISGFLLSYGVSWRYLIGGVSILGFISAAWVLIPARKGHEFPDHKETIHWKTTRDHATQILRTPRFWIFFAAMFFAGGGEFCLTFWCATYIQLSFAKAAWAGGVGTAAFAAGMVLGRIGWGIVIKQNQLRKLIIYSALVGTAVTFLFPWLQNVWVFFVLLFVAGIASAPYWPSVQSYCSDRMPEVDTTMLFILLSCAGIPGCGICTWLMGLIGKASGDLRVAFYIIPTCYLILSLLMIFESRGRKAQKKPTSD